MAKINRVFQKLFGSTGPSGEFGQFGSLAAGAGVNTKDPATIQALSAFLNGWGSAVTAGATPTLEETNSLFLLAFTQIAYILQAGIPEYDASTTYYSGSICQVAGVPYTSLQDNNTGNTPASSPSYWQAGFLNTAEPAGIIKDYAGLSVPSGHLVCDGSAVSRTTYSRLFTAIGTQWGVGDGSTTFNLPNLKGAATVGYDAAQTEFNAIGKTGGTKTHTLIAAEMPAHTHLAGKPNGPAGGGGDLPGNGSWYPGNFESQTSATSSAGGGGAHNNLQPYGTVYKIITY